MSSMASLSDPWRFLGWADADRRHTQSAQGETCDREQRCSDPWWAHHSYRTECLAGSESAASRGVDHPTPWSSHQWKASNSPGYKRRRETQGKSCEKRRKYGGQREEEKWLEMVTRWKENVVKCLIRSKPVIFHVLVPCTLILCSAYPKP